MRTPFLVPTSGPMSWQSLLADPAKHWRTGYSARALAHCWEDAKGLPVSVRAAFARAPVAAIREAEVLLAVPEHQVSLPGGGRPSQNDLWVLARGADELLSIAVEGKVDETFGPTVGEWLVDASPGKQERLSFLERCLELPEPSPHDVRYQLLHRTASAMLEARRFGARHAVLLVHSFSQQNAWIDDYQRFLELFGKAAGPGEIATLGTLDGLELHACWVTGEARYLAA